VLFGVLRLALLFGFKPLTRNQRRDEFHIQLAAIDDVTRVDAVGKERIIAVDILKQARGLMNLAVAATTPPGYERL
jgi:hypothetical protein